MIGAGLAVLAAVSMSGCGGTGDASAAATREIESHTAGDVVISLQSESGELTQGQDKFVLAFKSASSGEPVDAGSVMLSSSMTMPGMAPMVASIELEKTTETGRYAVNGEFGMSGAWKFEVRWDGPAGQGSTSFSTNVR